ncbi:MAG TPA: type IV pilus biogenesis/stability protein PilW [Pseudomonadales bacterium]|nr:type IV pilus biogenesis/stability protein PilW [Pseudomonadales bacterium]
MLVAITRLYTALVLAVFVLLTGCITEETRGDGQPVAEATKVSKTAALDDYITLANGYMKEGKREKSLRAINKGLELDPDSAAMLNVLAYYYSTDGEDKLSEKEYKRAISSDSTYTASYLNYGTFLFRQKRYDEACDMFAKATEDVMYGKRDAAFLNYGICLKQQGKMKEAEEAFRRSYVNDARNPLVVLELAQLKFDTGDFDQSLQLYNKFLGMSKQNSRSLWLGIRLMHVMGHDDKEAGYAMFLKNEFPASTEYNEYKVWSESK